MSIRYFPGANNIPFEDEVPQGQPEIETPFQEDAESHLVISQLYMQRGPYYRRPGQNARMPLTVHPAVAYFCEDSPRKPAGVADLVTWTRTWATKPPQIITNQQLVIQIPARGGVFRFDIGGAGAPFDWYPYLAAKGYNLPCVARIERDFYLIGPDSPGIDCDYASSTSIPQNNETIYTGKDVTTSGNGPLSEDQYSNIPAQNVGLFSGAVLDPLANSSGSGNLTFVAANLTSGNYYIGQSITTRYLGNIWERRSTRITI